MADENKGTAKMAWDLTWKRLDCSKWGSAEHWTTEQKKMIIDKAQTYLPERDSTYDNVFDMIKSVFNVTDITDKLQEESKENGVQDK